MVDSYMHYISPSSPHRAKLSVRVVVQPNPKEPTSRSKADTLAMDSKESTKIADTKAFKDGLATKCVEPVSNLDDFKVESTQL